MTKHVLSCFYPIRGIAAGWLQVREGAGARIGPAAVLGGCWLGGSDKEVSVGSSEVCTVETDNRWGSMIIRCGREGCKREEQEKYRGPAGVLYFVSSY